LLILDLKEFEELSCGGEVEISGGTNGWIGEGFAFGETVSDFVVDDSAEIGVGGFFQLALAAATVLEIRAVADVALILIGPTDEAVITVRLRVAMPGQVFWFHDGSLFH
jgi:hypothetical protein